MLKTWPCLLKSWGIGNQRSLINLKSSIFSTRLEVYVTKKQHDNTVDEILPCGLTVWAAGQIGQELVQKMHKQLPQQQELATAEARGSVSCNGELKKNNMVR